MQDRGMYQELRLALVFNGGVSLAVWMGGVAKELDRFRSAFARPDSPEIEPYRALLDALRTEVMADVIAGTSAGGINGAMLAYVVANRKSLECAGPDAIRATWQGLASLDNLVVSEGEPSSMLSSDVLFTGCADVMHKLENATEHLRPSVSSQVRLTVTATDAYGYTTCGSGVPARDHRLWMNMRQVDRPAERLLGDELVGAIAKVVKREPQSGWPFPAEASPRDLDGPDAAALLARAARTTASFPIAFAPSELPLDHSTKALAEGPSLTATPAMAQVVTTPSGRARTGHAVYAIDGGIWDNSPFSAVLRGIYRTPSARDVQRILVYVVGTPRPDAPKQTDKPPGLAEAFVHAMALPSNVSFANDVERIDADLNRQSSRREDILKLLVQGRPDLFALAEQVFPVYCERYLDVKAVGAELPSSDASLADWCATPAHWCWGIAPVRGAVEQARGLMRAVLRDFAGELELSQAEHNIVKRLIETREHLSQLAWVLDDLADLVADGELTPEQKAVCALSMEEFAKAVCKRHGEIEARVNDRPNPSDALRAAESLTAGGWEMVVKRALAVEVGLQSLGADNRNHKVDYSLTAIQPDDQWPLPADSDEPQDAPRPVLGGASLGHFGGFLRESWRLHDWMWGRLDGVARMVDALVDERQVRRLTGGSDPEGAIRALAARLADVAIPDSDLGRRLASEAYEARGLPVTEDREALAKQYAAELRDLKLDLLRADLRRRIQVPIMMEEIPGIVAAADHPEKLNAEELLASRDCGLRQLTPFALSPRPKFPELLVDGEKALANTFFGLDMPEEGHFMRAATRASGVLKSSMHVFALARRWFKRQRR
ncbi:MAG TPA: DUF3376 domain-containing protein [Thermoleophilaceae bacterium]|nr:DUF3376 domain-containing protein [Thermoleophilaceae bacterium]